MDIFRIEDRVHRPAGPWTNQIHQLLRHLRRQGFFKAPEPFDFDAQDQEILSYIEGNVGHYPFLRR